MNLIQIIVQRQMGSRWRHKKKGKNRKWDNASRIKWCMKNAAVAILFYISSPIEKTGKS